MIGLTDCVITLLLIIGNSPIESSYENPRFFGECLARRNSITAYISVERKALILVKQYELFEIELPKEKGYYQIQYMFGDDYAYIYPGKPIIVRRGPKGYW